MNFCVPRANWADTLLIRTQNEHPIIIDDGDAEAVELGEKDGRGKLDHKCLNRDFVLICCKPSGHSPETLKPSRFDVHSKHLGVLALKNAMCGARIEFCQEFDRLRSNGEPDRDVDSVAVPE